MTASLLSRKADGEQAHVYLAGKMRGLPEYGFARFHEATADLRARGFHVWSPAERDEVEGFNPATDEAKPLRYYMQFDIPAVLASDAVVVLDNWRDSQGASLEVHIARECGIPVYTYPDLNRLDDAPAIGVVRQFDTGATRDTDDGKLDFEGFFSPLVLRLRAEYMHRHRTQSDGTLRASDNWQRGIPTDAYMKSGLRHFIDWWLRHRGHDPISAEGGELVSAEEAICALMFNAEGYLHELLKAKAKNDEPVRRVA